MGSRGRSLVDCECHGCQNIERRGLVMELWQGVVKDPDCLTPKLHIPDTAGLSGIVPCSQPTRFCDHTREKVSKSLFPYPLKAVPIQSPLNPLNSLGSTQVEASHLFVPDHQQRHTHTLKYPFFLRTLLMIRFLLVMLCPKPYTHCHGGQEPSPILRLEFGLSRLLRDKYGKDTVSSSHTSFRDMIDDIDVEPSRGESMKF